jgi:hypothetical protein
LSPRHPLHPADQQGDRWRRTGIDLPLAGRRPQTLRVWCDEWVIQPGDDPSPVGRERVAEGRVRDRKLAIERGLETSRMLACPTVAAERRRKRSTVGRGNLPFRDPANAGRRFIPLLRAGLLHPELPLLPRRDSAIKGPCNIESA